MKADTLSISGVIQRNTLLRIPYFQRRYVWGEEDWERFAIDMESTLDSERYYFLGAIILKQENVTMEEKRKGIGKKQLVIDGQQRLTTLAIYMKVLHMLAAKSDDFTNQYLQATDAKDPVIIHSCDDMPQFRIIMHLDTLVDISEKSNISKAYSYFKDFLTERRDKGVNLHDLLNTVNAGVTFVVISLTQDDDEQQIFDTINSLGVPLTTGELMKNFLYEAQDEDAYKTSWKVIFDTDEARTFWESDAAKSRQSKSKENTTVERFFHAFVRIKMWDFKDQLTDSQRKNFVKVENIFTTCKAFVEKFGMNKQDLANEIIEYAKLFRKFLGSDILDIRLPQHFGIKRISCLINATKSYSVIPYVLYILKTVGNEAERNKIFAYLEIYIIRRVLAKSSNNNYSDLFSENLIGQRVKTFDDLKAYIESKNDVSALAMPQMAAIQKSLNNNKFDETTARIIYYLYETKLSKTSEGSFTEGFNAYVCEQFMPKPCTATSSTWPPHADKDEEENRRQLSVTLGNYFLLDIDNEKSLKSIHNASFATKLPKMKEWSTTIRSNNILNTIASWDETSINKRNNLLVKAMSETIWALL